MSVLSGHGHFYRLPWLLNPPHDLPCLAIDIPISLEFKAVSDEIARERLIAGGVSRAEAAGIVALWCAIRENQLSTVTGTVESVLGRKPITFDHWVTENKSQFS